MASIAASLNPGEWTSDVSSEENLKTFNRYVTRFERWLDVCGMDGFSDKQKWQLLMATAGNDMEDLVLHQAGIQTKLIPEVPAVRGVPAGEGGVPPAVIAVEGRPGVNPTPWQDGLELCKAAISKYSNQITARNRLFTKTPASDYPNWRKWGQELLEQAKRCVWAGYGAEQAALDALLYQCPDKGWKKKILGGKLNFWESVSII